MKLKKRKILVFTVLGLILVLVVANLLEDHTSYQESAENNIRSKALAVLKDNDCMNCHLPEQPLPAIAKLPLIGSIIANDVELGVRSFKINDLISNLESNNKVSETNIAKIEHAVLYNTMPTLNYKVIHWGATLNDDEKNVLLNWVKEERSKYYKSTTADVAFKNEPIKPIETLWKTDPAKVMLGNALFHDTRLSANNTISCATCHSLSKGGTDQLPVSVGIYDQEGPINSPTVFNAVHNIAQFWDGRAADLQAQAAGPPLDSKEMGNKSFDEIVERLSKDENMEVSFKAIYPEGITQNSITDAIAEFEKTLLTPDAPFDKYLRGDINAITEEQKEGYRLFKERGCTNCHAGEAVGGLSFERMGIFGDYYADRGTELTEADKGRAKCTGEEKDMYYQKTPILRNVSLTAPYFHDASAKTLKEAVVAMGKYQVKNSLTDKEAEMLVQFLESLTGEYNGVVLK